MSDIDVVVVGAGPVGLLTAIELTLGGVTVLLLERLAAPSMVAKALGAGPLGIEALQRRGLCVAVQAAEERSFAAMKALRESDEPELRPVRKFSGHFGGLTLIRADAQKEPDRRLRLADQQSIESMLSDRAVAAGIKIHRGCDVTKIVQDSSSVEVEWTSPAGVKRMNCSWIIGCDGGRSPIRKMAGFDFPGSPPTLTMYSAVVEIDHPERLMPVGWHHTSGGMFSYGAFFDRLFMLDFSGPPEDRLAPVLLQEIESVLRQISGADVRVKSVESANRWTDNTRLVDTYRLGRVLLAGDAAHVHSPFGGQGMSLGLVDAQNLGWKLAAVIRGEMPECLLDTYTAERRPIAEAVLANTRAQTAIMRPDPQSSAMRDLLANMLQFDDVNRYFGEMMSGLGTRYDLGSEQDEVGRLIGDRQIMQADGETSLYDLMQDGRGILLDASVDGRASKIVQASTQRIRCVTATAAASMLIRPDACIAWIGEGGATDGLAESLSRWFCRTLVAMH